MRKKSNKILVAMSGGVDSSVAALLLKRSGHYVIGASMHLYSCSRPGAKSCCSDKDRMDARRVCEKIGIPFVSLDLRDQFRKKVIEPFVDEYQNGRTPSPCILCNTHLKFDCLLDETAKFGATSIATGHYARITLRARPAETGESRSEYRLLRGADRKKDQSYFLFQLMQDQLGKIHFPIGHLTKDEVRKIAREHDLPTSQKAESQEICFVPDNDYASFIEQIRPDGIKGPGNFIGLDGKILGRHSGIHNYTIGQRRGLGFGTGSRQYVVKIDPRRNEIVLGSGNDLLKQEMRVREVSWIGKEKSEVEVQIRSAHTAARADLKIMGDNEVDVVFEKPQKAVAPGQAAVFYNGNEVLGGGWID